MLPYQTAVAAMDYGAAAASFQRHHPQQSGIIGNVGGSGGLPMSSHLTSAGLGVAPSVNMNMNPAAAAFTHSWFVPADFAYKHNSNHHHGSVPVLEPGHVFNFFSCILT